MTKFPDTLRRQDIVVVFTDELGEDWTEETAEAIARRMMVADLEEVRLGLIAQCEAGALEHLWGWTFQRIDFRSQQERRLAQARIAQRLALRHGVPVEAAG